MNENADNVFKMADPHKNITFYIKTHYIKTFL